LRNIINVAVAVPMLDCNLLVANADRGGKPAIIKAGSVNKPPPPANVSRKPATMATKNKKANNS